jgi:hypothetical protein
MVIAVVYDCNNAPHYNFQLFTSPAGVPAMNFSICDVATPPGCQANFLPGYTPNSLHVSFADLSVPSSGSNIVSWFWSFGDSTTSTLQNPVHTYFQSGTYYVCLTITDATNCNSTACQIVSVAGTPPVGCTAGFSAMPVGGTTAVNFQNTSLTTYPPALYNTVFTWSFGDGTSATSSTPGLMNHTYAQPGTYTVCLTMQVLDAQSNPVCNHTYCSNVTAGGGSQTGFLYGMLYANNLAAGPSVVYLIENNSLLGTLTAVDTTFSIDSSGTTAFYFPNITPGNYLVKAAMLPANPNYAANMPTYHQSSLFWNQATTVNVLPNAFTQASVNYIQGLNPGGPGFVGGLISQGANKGPGDPIEKVQVMLLDVLNGDQPVAVAYSDAAGHFEFNGIPFGTYKVYAEMLNKTTNPVIVTVDAANPSTDAIQIVVGATVISFINETPLSSGVVGTIYPNPASDLCFIPIHLNKNTSLKIELVDLTGKTIRAELRHITPGPANIAFDITNLPAGVYMMAVSASDGEKTTRKLVIK